MNKTIKIKVVDGKVRVTPNSCKARHHYQIEWQSNLRFIVYFGYLSPLDKKIFSNNQPGGIVKYDATYSGPKKFKYLVGVIYNNKILMKDPELDIQP